MGMCRVFWWEVGSGQELVQKFSFQLNLRAMLIHLHTVLSSVMTPIYWILNIVKTIWSRMSRVTKTSRPWVSCKSLDKECCSISRIYRNEEFILTTVGKAHQQESSLKYIHNRIRNLKKKVKAGACEAIGHGNTLILYHDMYRTYKRDFRLFPQSFWWSPSKHFFAKRRF